MILITFGTRPEYIKVKPIIDELNKDGKGCVVLFTGQHQDLLKDVECDSYLSISELTTNRLNNVVANILTKELSAFFKNNSITHVLVQGDTSSAFAMALTAKHHQLKVIHLEAGLRSKDKENPYPEEFNRLLIAQLADIHLCATENNADNLRQEGIYDNIYVVGNTVLDNLENFKGKEEYTNKVLITMHRRENHEMMGLWFDTFKELSEEYPELEFIFPIHPNPNVQKYRERLGDKIKIVDPMSRDELLDVLVKTKLVITDSGGLQEECSFFNKKCLVCRETTERPESLRMSSFLVKPMHLYDMFYEHINSYEIDIKSPFGDGNSAEKIIKILTEFN